MRGVNSGHSTVASQRHKISRLRIQEPRSRVVDIPVLGAHGVVEYADNDEEAQLRSGAYKAYSSHWRLFVEIWILGP